MAKLIVESDIRPLEVITEANTEKNAPRTITLRGVFMEAEEVNINGRYYLLDELIKEVENFNKTMILPGRALCELEHPDTNVINPDRACARITSLRQEGKQFIGEAVVLAADPEHGILGTPCGTTLASLLQYGTSVGFSSRGIGELVEDANDIPMVTNYNLITVDCVLQPSIGKFADSDANRFVNGILESKEYVINSFGDAYVEKFYTPFENQLKHLPKNRESRQEKIIAATKQFLESLKI